jgi:hypothetical protein
MPPALRITRGVKDIRTRSGAPDQTVVPYKAYMAITVLEIEKFRRQTERQSLIIRLKNLSARLRRIDTEKTVLLDRLSKLSARQSAPRAAASLNASGPGLLGGFKFQY